ncbi:hypothetical protein [Actinoplanes derwentensis]|uniref:hypothetical protein n=1 Tax=Actinoplanes derwentensis TaxID=113562 RepID=UPI0012FD126E|nr:hypothetical protein [Actinoplanes derwentensis]
MGKRSGDLEALSELLRIIRRRVPDVVAATFETSDQDYVGFVLTGVELRTQDDAVQFDPEGLDALAEETWPLTSAIGWDGVMGEDKYGHARVSLASGEGSWT